MISLSQPLYKSFFLRLCTLTPNISELCLLYNLPRLVKASILPVSFHLRHIMLAFFTIQVLICY